MDATPLAPPPPRPGQLTPFWTNVHAVAWSGVCLGLGVVAIASRRLGLSVWWLGPDIDAVPFYVTIVPFLLPVATVLATLAGVRRAPLLGIAAALAVGAVAVGDISRSGGLAAIEGVLAAGGLLVSLAALSGTVRPAAQN